jgi:hypothetical protein
MTALVAPEPEPAPLLVPELPAACCCCALSRLPEADGTAEPDGERASWDLGSPDVCGGDATATGCL